MKTCCDCKNQKNNSEFGKNKYNKDGLEYRCKSCRKEKYKNNKDEINKKRRLKQKEVYQKNKDKIKKYADSRRLEKAKYDSEYREQNKEKIRNYKKEWEKNKKNDPVFKIKRNLRRRLNHVVAKTLKADKTFNLIGCSAEEFKLYLESKFLEGMSWQNYGKGWHIDHIIPCSAFDLSKQEEQRKCFHFSNCQPLWKKDNLKKSYIHNGQNCRIIKNKNYILK